MRKILCFLLVMSCFLAFTACREEKGGENESAEGTVASTETEVGSGTEAGAETAPLMRPEGYSLFNNGTLTFAYPHGWVVSQDTLVFIQDASGNRNNITVATEDKTDQYDDLTVESYHEMMGSIFEGYGGSIANVAVEHTVNGHGTAVIVASCDATLFDTSMKQTQFIVTVGEKTYTITSTEVIEHAEMTQAIFDTLRIN